MIRQLSRNIFLLLFIFLCMGCAILGNSENLPYQGNFVLTSESTVISPESTPSSFFQDDSTITTYPTLNPTESNDQISSLLLNNGECNYPCFWGITPGVSSWEETRNYFETFGTIHEVENDPSVYTAIFTDPNLIGNEFTFIFFTNNDQISYLRALTSMSVSEVLQQFGMPDEVQVAVLTSPDGIEADYLLVFLERGFMIRYKINYIYHLPEIIPNEQGFSMNLCPRDFIPDYETTHNYYNLISWDPNSVRNFVEVYDEVSPILNTLAPEYHEIRTVSNIDLEQFFSIWLYETDDCFILECPDCVINFSQQ